MRCSPSTWRLNQVLTLVAFARGNTLNVYAGEHRIIDLTQSVSHST
jgi:hypothetical protein